MTGNIRSSVWVDVDFTKSKRELINAGKYGYVDSRLMHGEFPVKGSGTGRIQILIVNFGRPMTSAEILNELEEMKLRPINFRELLAIGKQYPNLQRNFPIVALGSAIWKDAAGAEYCGILSKFQKERWIGVSYLNENKYYWKSECCFGAISLLS